jgi:hypothetical protein
LDGSLSKNGYAPKTGRLWTPDDKTAGDENMRKVQISSAFKADLFGLVTFYGPRSEANLARPPWKRTGLLIFRIIKH